MPDPPPGDEPPPAHMAVVTVPWLRFFVTLGGVLTLLVFWLLYTGRELPWVEMRYQYTDSTGYQPMPEALSTNPGMGRPRYGRPYVFIKSVPRDINGRPATGLMPDMPDLPDGSIPPEAAALVNPTAGDHAAVIQGETVYVMNCMMCHGRTGRGDGAVGESYTPKPPDLHSAAVQALPDGALFYSVTNGILSTPVPEAARYIPRDWHAFKDELSPRQRWAVVDFVRALAAGREPFQPPRVPGEWR
ncbi:MAG TPA: cytochrome c [Armatimonadota bacterium]|nr:cytochrome c [Armatimonadota bacterium]